MIVGCGDAEWLPDVADRPPYELDCAIWRVTT